MQSITDCVFPPSKKVAPKLPLQEASKGIVDRRTRSNPNVIHSIHPRGEGLLFLVSGRVTSFLCFVQHRVDLSGGAARSLRD